MTPAKCATCGHRADYHTILPRGCWYGKVSACEWPCRCGQEAEQMEIEFTTREAT